MADYSFTSGVNVGDVGVPGRDLPAFGQAQAMQQAVYQMQIENMRWTLHEKAAGMELAVKQRQGMAALNKVLADGIGPNADLDQTMRALYGVGASYAIPPEKFDSVIQQLEVMKQRRALARGLGQSGHMPEGWQMLPTYDEDGNVSYRPVKVDNPGERERAAKETLELKRRAKEAFAAGDTELGQQLEAEAEHKASFFKTPGTTVTTGYDDQGRPIISTSMGGTVGERSPTVGFQSKAQTAMVKYANATQLINSLSKSLRPEDVGARGIVGEYAVDRGLAQLYPDVANKGRIENRTALGMLRESLLREVSDDTRFSNMDRQAISRILPSDGVFESYEDAIGRMSKVRQILADRARVYADKMGEPIPEFAMTVDEVRERYQRQIAAIKKELDENRITPEQAQAAANAAYDKSDTTIKRFHQ